MNPLAVGMQGELKVCNSIISDSTLNMKYIHNFPLQKATDGYYQVDIVLVCNRGIFCLEVKTWECTVRCSSKYYWEVVYPSRTIFVHSPLHQNMQHCKLISDITHENVRSVVVFSDNTVIENAISNVIHVSDLVGFIKGHPIVFSPQDVDRVYNTLAAYKDEHYGGLLLDSMIKNFQKFDKYGE